MAFPTNSLRARFIATASVLLALVLPALVYTQIVVNETSNRSARLIAGQRDLQAKLNGLEQAVQTTESQLYYYSLSLDESEKQQVFKYLVKAHQDASDLAKHFLVNSNSLLLDTTRSIQKSLENIQLEAQGLFELLERVETRYPAAPILLEKLQPASAEFNAAIEQATLESKELVAEPQQQNILNLLRDLRYAWAQQVNSVRVYIANRSGIFGQPGKGMADTAMNRELYVAHVVELLNALSGFEEKGLLGFQQSIALNQMRGAINTYERDFRKAASIYNSDNWRADVPFFNNNVRPAFTNFWVMLYQFEDGLEGLSSDNIQQQITITDQLSHFILLMGGFVLFAILSSFAMLEFVIRRPIVEITKALDAEAKGQSYIPVLASYTTHETDVLVAAFQEMREQVRSRQKRLQAILDNAGEGIITIDANGTIETFNNAAQLLFGYTAAEVLGKSSNDIIRLAEPVAHGEFFEFCLSPYNKNQINEVVVSVLHKDGARFPMSINVNDLWVEGRQLFIILVEDISERVALLDNLRMMAEHDSLTGLFNREYFMTELDRVVENIKRGVRGDFALLYIDLDNFKFVNDTLGHMAGDQLLVEITQMFSRRNRKSDLLARLGGDEFAILIYGAKRTQVVAAAESHRRLLADYAFKYAGKVVNIGCSIGVTLFGQESLVKEDLLAQADVACHIAKHSGRNRVHVYQHHDRRNVTAMSEDMGWATLIKNAIDNEQFIMLCQPIADTLTNRIDRYEVLLRMKGEDGQSIQPAGFLPAAERFGLIQSIDQWVVRNAIALLSRLQQTQAKAQFSINLSAKSLDDNTMFHTITTALKQHSVNPTSVTFEITENAAIANLHTAIDFLKRLRALGCHTALDDFGVGYSSFAYLKDLPVDYVKIDGSFVQNVNGDNLQFTMVRAMNDVAHAMGKLTVAEYVDSADCLERLRVIGVDFAQGFYIGEPRVIGVTKPANTLISA